MAGEMTGRNPQGRFEKGVSGNPRGRPKGARSRATLVAEALRAGEGETLLRNAIEAGVAGKWGPNRFVLEWLHPRPRGREVEFDLPLGATAEAGLACWDALIGAVGAGEMTPDEAATVARLLEARERAAARLRLGRRLAEAMGIGSGDTPRAPRDPAGMLADLPDAEIDALAAEIAAEKARRLGGASPDDGAEVEPAAGGAAAPAPEAIAQDLFPACKIRPPTPVNEARGRLGEAAIGPPPRRAAPSASRAVPFGPGRFGPALGAAKFGLGKAARPSYGPAPIGAP